MKYKHLLLSLALSASPLFAQADEKESPIGYNSIDEAFTALQADPEAKTTDYEGWTIFTQKSDGRYILWSFTPETHASHPAVVRRIIVKKDEEMFIEMSALCHATKLECDKLIDDFKQINERIKRDSQESS